MGLAIAVIYLPLFAIASAIALFLSLAPLREPHEKGRTWQKSRWYALGTTLSTCLTIYLAWRYSTQTKEEWGPIFGSLAISLVTPLLIGIFALLAWKLFPVKSLRYLNFFVAGTLHATFFIPGAGFLFYLSYDHLFIKPSFDQLCSHAAVVTTERVPPAKSFALLSGFVTSNRTTNAYQNIDLLLLYPLTPLDFIETKQLKWNGTYEYLRKTSTRKSQQALSADSRSNSPYVTTAIDSINAEYLIESTRLEIPANLAGRTYGRRIEVIRASDKQRISHIDYYWDTRKWWECPYGIGEKYFFMSFVANSLNLPTNVDNPLQKANLSSQ